MPDAPIIAAAGIGIIAWIWTARRFSRWADRWGELFVDWKLRD